MTDLRVDVAVVGAGLMGSATAWELSRRGGSVALIEQFDPGHPHGSSHGTERIVRRAYADPFYVRLTGRALDAWAQAEDDTDTSPLQATGGLDSGAARDPAGLARLMAAEGVPCEMLTADDAQARWPGMVFDGPVLFHPQAGTVDAAAAVAAWPTIVHKAELQVFGMPSGADGGPEPAFKVGQHDGGIPTTASTRDGVVDPACRERIVRHVVERLPGLDPEPVAEATCLYTATPDEDFVLDRIGPVVLVSPCSGHGAKFAPLIGAMAADLALGVTQPEPRFARARTCPKV